ncbi:cyanophycinase [Epilithonimonas arachidiradicis]|uniref:Cyanophycinase n=1 Tax=Epilithonimonas arachidiradicis TaxID=1617282 RepID=A0A420D8U7_9FLAO|nr:cyanophycinase [Epilithonimonas arachidiradicis]RKE87201.1 cyanophycinase [Epilithonimonas arachidiradicis]GGG59106.1 cyanophycinase [Epilithonimonas arachidiradicis]
MTPKGRLIIIGGKEDKSETDSEMEDVNQGFISKEILKLIAESKDDRIEVITTATSDPDDMEKTYTDTFKGLGYSNFGFLYITGKTNKESLQRIEDAKTIFFSGGDQSKICDVFRNSEIIERIHKRYLFEKDFTIAGTSAGAMCMSSVMIADAINGEAIVGYDLKLDKGLGFLNCIIDTHFVHRGRFGRLAHAAILHPELLGIGLGEDTSLVIEQGKVATCKGSGMVIIINSKHIKQTNVETVKKGCPVYAENLVIDILTEDCKINLETGEIDVSENL